MRNATSAFSSCKRLSSSVAWRAFSTSMRLRAFICSVVSSSTSN
jgi:hypothetical protein